MSAYTITLAIHNIFRWVVVILAITALVMAYSGWLGKRNWTSTNRKINTFFTVSLDIQLLLGLLLYFVFSDIVRSALSDLGAAMQSPDARFFAVEHSLYMLAAVILAHIGSARARRVQGDAAKHRQAAIWFSLAVLAIILGMPWMRPLLPGL